MFVTLHKVQRSDEICVKVSKWHCKNFIMAPPIASDIVCNFILDSRRLHNLKAHNFKTIINTDIKL